MTRIQFQRSIIDIPEDSVKHPSDVIGNWGPFQCRLFLFLTIIYSLAVFQNLSLVFYAPKTDFYCIDINPATGRRVRLMNTCFFDNGTTCTEFEYDVSFYKRTLVNTFDLVCDKKWYASLAQSIHQVGYAISGLGLGLISDKYGRKTCALFAVSLEIFAGLGLAFSPSIYLFFFFRLLVGIASYGRFLNGYVLLMEWVGPKLRQKVTVWYEFGYSGGYILLPIIFYFIRDYRVIQTGVAVIEFLFLIVYIYLVTESPRFQLTHGRLEEARESLTRAASMKGKLTSNEIEWRIIQLKQNTEKEMREEQNLDKQSIFDVWKNRKLLRMSIILYFSWFLRALVTSRIGGSIFVNFFVLGCSTILTNIILLMTVARVGRRRLFITFMSVQTASLFAIFCLSFNENLVVYRLVFYFIFNTAGSGAGNILYLYTAETFPTTMRQAAIGTCSIFARVGSVISPFIKELTKSADLFITTGVFASLSLLNLFLFFLVPETDGIELPDTIRQASKGQDD
jgi:OCT family organic cation transporter-like MFS transporter 4/5